MFYNAYNCYIIWKIYMYKSIKRKILTLNAYVREYILIKGVTLSKFNPNNWHIYIYKSNMMHIYTWQNKSQQRLMWSNDNQSIVLIKYRTRLMKRHASLKLKHLRAAQRIPREREFCLGDVKERWEWTLNDDRLR